MSLELVGRAEERTLLEEFYRSHCPEFLAVYGRRRVGKTFLIKQFFAKKKCLFFSVTGIQHGELADQIDRFFSAMGHTFYKGAPLKRADNWFEAFDFLLNVIERFVQKNQKIVLFFDEFPWLVTHRSKLLTVFEYFWNQHWSQDARIKLIICGSSASWIINNILNNKGGLHNRVTRRMQLLPFNLRDSKKFLSYQGIKLNNRQITQLYMVTGGIPYYLSSLKSGLSSEQLIESLAFERNSLLFNEFDNLFSSLFDHAEIYIDIIRVIAKNRYGVDEETIVKSCKNMSRGGRVNSRLKQLEDAGFVISVLPFQKKRGIYYRVIDEYTLFYLRWIEPLKKILQKSSLESGYWERECHSPAWASWSGYAFEAVCYKHLSQIRKKLGINPSALGHVWRYSPKKGDETAGAQIDLLFDRRDDTITVCEIKYSDKPFVITKAYAKNLLNKCEVFVKDTLTTKQILLAMVASSDIKRNVYAEDLVTGVVTLDDLFS